MGNSKAITISIPPAAVLRVVNPLLRLLLHTPVMGTARRGFMVVSVTGRRTGRRYTIPLAAHRIDGDLYALTSAPWQHNFRDGATVRVFFDGKATTMRGTLVNGVAEIAEVYWRCAQSYGASNAQRKLAMTFRDKRIPALEDFAAAVEQNHLAAVRLVSPG
jgi:hypothetical protein